MNVVIQGGVRAIQWGAPRAVQLYRYYSGAKGAESALSSTQEAADKESAVEEYECRNCQDPKCKELEKEIDDIINKEKNPGDKVEKGLRQRFDEMVNPKHELMERWDSSMGVPKPEHGTIEGHQAKFQERQKALQDKLHEWNKNDCGTPPRKAWKWATAQAPRKGELWKRP